MMMCKQAKQGVPLQAEQADWLADTDEEIDETWNRKAHLSFLGKDSGECADERAALANLIANLTLDTEETKDFLSNLIEANDHYSRTRESAKLPL
ncbi:hypothetical protein Tco_1576152 [Tanacetum coccineum]